MRKLVLESLEVRQLLTAWVGLAAEPAVSHNLILITHGWNSNVDDWPMRMQANIVQQLNEAAPRDGVEAQPVSWSETQAILSHVRPAADTNVFWEVATFDWRESASTFLPTSAANNAANLGTQYVSQIVQAHYDAVQVIAHSAGAWLIDALAAGIESAAPEIVTQATFLDAYTPGDKATIFGTSADYAEHYVDKGVLPSTNSDFTHALNIDLSLWGPDSTADTLSFGVAGHSWPWQWYLETTAAPETSRWGFAVALCFSPESFPSDPDGSVIVLGHTGDSNDDGHFNTSDLIAVFTAGKFETGTEARWFEGDWDGNGRFDTADLVFAFQSGGYEG